MYIIFSFLANNPIKCNCEIKQLLEYSVEKGFNIGGSCHMRNGEVTLLAEVLEDDSYCGKLSRRSIERSLLRFLWTTRH